MSLCRGFPQRLNTAIDREEGEWRGAERVEGERGRKIGSELEDRGQRVKRAYLSETYSLELHTGAELGKLTR